MDKARYLFIFLIIVISLPPTVEASQVDFAWSTPENLIHKKDTDEENKYLIWVYSISNTIDKTIEIPVATLLTTDTNKFYEPGYIPEIATLVSEGKEEYISSNEMKGEYSPGVTKKCIAIFEDVDPYARKVNIFMTGLSHFFFWRWRLSDYSYKITYKKSGNNWVLEEHGFSKDNSHRNHVDKFKGSQPDINYWP